MVEQTELQPMVSLTVDRFDRIIALSDNWQAVAQQGQAEKLLNLQAVIGRHLGYFIRGDDTRMYTEASLKLCRARQEVLYRHYRCDSPSHKRFMKLQLMPLPNKAVQMNHFLLKEEAFDHPVHIDDIGEKFLPENNGILNFVRCSMCNSLKRVGSNKWFDPDKLTADDANHVAVIHSICPDCKTQAWHRSPKKS